MQFGLKKRRDCAIDIETIATPENSGYDVVIPNYAIVVVPDVPQTYELEWMYVQMPIQEQINKGLKMDAAAMQFWFDKCAKDNPRALEEMKKSFPLVQAEFRTRNFKPTQLTGDRNQTVDNPSELVARFISNMGTEESKLWGNGCHFDCSLLQQNHKVMYGNGNMWHYSAPQNARSLKDLLSVEEREEMDAIVTDYLSRFETMTRINCGIMNLELHHPLYDAAREALQISYCRQKKMG